MVLDALMGLAHELGDYSTSVLMHEWNECINTRVL